jgi:hypothetical protein
VQARILKKLLLQTRINTVKNYLKLSKALLQAKKILSCKT